MKFRILTLTAAAILLLASCGNKQESASSDAVSEIISSSSEVSSAEVSSEAEDSSKSETSSKAAVSAAYTVASKEFKDTEHANSEVKIKYPALSGEKDFSKVNSLIKSDAAAYINTFYGDDYEDLTASIDYKISYKDEKLISIIFSGEGMVQGSAYPNNIFYTLNINLETGKKVKLSDKQKIDDSFADKILKAEKEQISEEYQNPISVSFGPILKDTLMSADDGTSGVYSYYTKDAIGVSFPVIHALGDHIEVEVKK